MWAVISIFLRILMRGLRLSCLALALLLVAPLCELHAEEPERVSLLIRELKNDRGEIIPIKNDIRQLLSLFEREAKVQFDIHYYPMPRLLASIKNGEGIGFGLSKTTDRLETMQFSEVIFANHIWLITRKNNTFAFSKMEDLKGKVLGVMRGVSYGEEFEQRKNILFKVEEDVASHVLRLKKLSMKRMDAMLFGARITNPLDVEVLLRQMQAANTSEEISVAETEFTVLPKPLRIDELHFAAGINKYNDVIKRLDIAISKGRKNGEIMRILTTTK